MRLSEAVRLGAMSKPQGIGNESAHPQADRTCAIGAALFAVSAEVKDSPYGAMCQLFPISAAPVAHPVYGFEECLMDVMFSLNDSCNWTREKIADWVESIERERGLIVEPAAEPESEMERARR